jgi:hypothetical protein
MVTPHTHCTSLIFALLRRLLRVTKSLLLLQMWPQATPHCICCMPLTISYANMNSLEQYFASTQKMQLQTWGATQNFVMEGMPIVNRRTTTHPLKVALASGRIVMSTHMCDIHIEGLPTVLTGHIIPNLSIASLFGIRVLTDTGCTVTFDKEHCTVQYNGNIIFSGNKDPSTDLWSLPLGSNQGKTSHHVNNLILPAAPVNAGAHANMTTQIAFFMHTVRNKANSICFAHQSLCRPKTSTLLKAIKLGYLKGCPNLTTTGVTNIKVKQHHKSRGHNFLTKCVWAKSPDIIYTLTKLRPAAMPMAVLISNRSPCLWYIP